MSRKKLIVLGGLLVAVGVGIAVAVLIPGDRGKDSHRDAGAPIAAIVASAGAITAAAASRRRKKNGEGSNNG